MAFAGYLYKFGSRELPLRYIQWEGVNANPNQRTEAEAWTNSNNELVRSTYTRTRSKLVITFREGLTDTDYGNIFSIMSSGLQNATERKYTITYWSDDTFSYKTGSFYLANPQFAYKKVTENSIIYKSVSFSFVEY